MIINDFYCTQCGNKGIPLARTVRKQREAGHLKKIYCLHCKKEVNHAEIHLFGKYSYEVFFEEFKLGRFVDGIKTPTKDLPICNKTECYYNRDGRCWNSKEDYLCDRRV